MSDAKTQAPEQPKIDKIGFDNLIEDLFGLNFRALQTIGVLFKSPKKYFDAARTPEWLNKYTPSFRVWIGLIAAMAALKFLYAADSSAMVSIYVDQFKQLEAQMNVGVPAGSEHVIDVDLAAKSALKWLFAIYPFVYIPVMALAAIFLQSLDGSPHVCCSPPVPIRDSHTRRNAVTSLNVVCHRS